MNQNKIQHYRDERILGLHEAKKNKTETEYEKIYSESLFGLGLTMYSKNYSFKSAIYNGFACSHIDDNVSLHPEQMKVLNLIRKNKGLIFSAPTSFGKTFIVFEYIARAQPKNVVLVVPTLALSDEYRQKISRKYREAFSEYKIYTNFNSNITYDSNTKNLFIVTHDRVVQNEVITRSLPDIDFLVVDEVYKLKTDENNDRVLILNLAYRFLKEKSKKYLLLAPFLTEIINNKGSDAPLFFSSDFSAVVNRVYEHKIKKDKERNQKIDELLNELKKTKCLVYFNTVKALNKFIIETKFFNEDIDENKTLNKFIEWASKEIHPEWSVLKGLKKGILVHHGQLPLGIRILQMELFNDQENKYYVMLCTSTLLEGVNTSCENIIITNPKINKTKFNAFDFFNLVGRSGRLFQYYLGQAHYIRKKDEDEEYRKEDALKSIEFELTDKDNIDMDINSGNYKKHKGFTDLLEEMNISYDEYIKNFATQFRYKTINFLFRRFNKNKHKLYKEIENMLNNQKPSKLSLVKVLYKIMNDYSEWQINRDAFVINKLTYKSYENVKTIVNDTYKHCSKDGIDSIINLVLKLKNNLEHDFYKKAQVILYFMKLENASEKLKKLIEEKIIKTIEHKYYMHFLEKRMLKDMGVYDQDIDKITETIKNVQSFDELLVELKENYKKIQPQISIVSRFVIEKLIK